jgi:hypothetical protein
MSTETWCIKIIKKDVKKESKKDEYWKKGIKINSLDSIKE